MSEGVVDDEYARTGGGVWSLTFSFHIFPPLVFVVLSLTSELSRSLYLHFELAACLCLTGELVTAGSITGYRTWVCLGFFYFWRGGITQYLFYF